MSSPTTDKHTITKGEVTLSTKSITHTLSPPKSVNKAPISKSSPPKIKKFVGDLSELAPTQGTKKITLFKQASKSMQTQDKELASKEVQCTILTKQTSKPKVKLNPEIEAKPRPLVISKSQVVESGQ